MLIGQYDGNLGEKNRVAIPKKFRLELGETIIVAKWYEGCLVLVSQDKWQDLLDRVSGKSGYVTEPVRDTDRFILGSAFELSPDSQGRIVIPQALREYANFGGDVTFLGLRDRVEAWDKATWRKKEDELTQNAAKMMEKIAEYGKER